MTEPEPDAGRPARPDPARSGEPGGDTCNGLAPGRRVQLDPASQAEIDALEASFNADSGAGAGIGSDLLAAASLGSDPLGDTALDDTPLDDTALADTALDDVVDGELLDDITDGELADDAVLRNALEALLLVVDEPADETQLAIALGQPTARVTAALHGMAATYRDQQRGIDLRKVGEGWRFYTRDRYAHYVERMLGDGQRAKLSRAALETLAVVAYRQPVTRARVSAVRGVNCDGVMRTLVTRGLVEEFGVEPQTQAILYRTSELFLERLGLSSLAELPPLAPLLPEVDAIDDV